VREFTRCIAWALGLGGLAFAAAVMTDASLAQSEGWRAWALLAVYAPFHLAVHLLQSSAALWREDMALTASAVVGQFLYYLAIVAAVRWVWRRRRRARR
jgi:hypothetical protein